MKIVAIADTHIPKKSKQLPDRLIGELKTADLILHAGDWSSIDIYHELCRYAPVEGVYGNIEEKEVKDYFPFKQLIEVGGFKIGITHGHGEKKTTEKRAIEVFKEEMPDVIIFGHSHIPMIRYFKKTLLVNPGSPTDKRQLPFYSFAVLHMNEEIKAEMVFFK